MSSIYYIAFLVIIGICALVSLLSMYVVVRYGRTRSIALLSSAVFIVLFIFASLAVLSSLQALINQYAA